jgi:hypothetical protein
MVVQEAYRSHKKINLKEGITRSNVKTELINNLEKKTSLDISNLDSAHKNLLDVPLSSFSKNERIKESINIIIARKFSNLRNRNKLRKDKKSAHFLFILVFTFFVCWVRIFLKIPDIDIY